jgi:hypothetical protein
MRWAEWRLEYIAIGCSMDILNNPSGAPSEAGYANGGSTQILTTALTKSLGISK